jgi:hypothetical protein
MTGARRENWQQGIAQQRKECHVRFDASVGVHSQSLGHRHVGNPATASVAHCLQCLFAPKTKEKLRRALNKYEKKE